jgi:hypothetical protein
MRCFAAVFILAGAAAAPATAAPATATTASVLAGNWTQVLSNYYVQTTTEIDWKCVRVHVVESIPGRLTLYKSAVQHSAVDGVPVHAYPVNMTLEDQTYLVPYPRQFLRRPGDPPSLHIRRADRDLAVLTGRNDISLYVWTRKSLSEYYMTDHVQVLADLGLWGYVTFDKTPLASFTSECTTPPP